MLNSRSWPMCNGDANFLDQHTLHTPFLTGYEKDAVKKTMLEHDAVFKKQVYELHRLYKVQRELMEEVRREEVHKKAAAAEALDPSPPDDTWRWRFSNPPSPSCLPGKALDLRLCADEYIEDKKPDRGARPTGGLGLLLGRGVGLYALRADVGKPPPPPVNFFDAFTPPMAVFPSRENNCVWLSYMFEQERKRVGSSTGGPQLVPASLPAKEHDLFPVPSEVTSVISGGWEDDTAPPEAGPRRPNGVDLNVVLPGLCGPHSDGWEAEDEDPAAPKDAASLASSSSASVEERATESRESRARTRQIDLNLSAAEEDDTFTGTDSTSGDPGGLRPGEEAAAEAIVMISSSRVKAASPSLAAFHMLVDAVSSAGEEGGVDHFEAMTLNLKEERAVAVGRDEAAAAGGGRPGGRGRRRGDFQRDILPGIVTLSRQEVSEDLQRFGGMLRAAGRVWRCGPARRGGGRQNEPSAGKTESGLEEGRLGGWGKATRRRRRPRAHPAADLLLDF